MKLLRECILPGCTELVARTGPCSRCCEEFCVDTSDEAIRRVKQGDVAIYWHERQSSAQLEKLQRAIDEADERARRLFAFRKRHNRS